MGHIHELYDFTTSAFVLHPAEPKICLLFHNKLQKWLQPGGHVELDENPWEALTHELDEETGLDLTKCEILLQHDYPLARGNKVLPVPFYLNEHPMGNLPSHKHIDICYLVKSYTEELTENPDGASAIGWFSELEIQELYSTDKMFDGTLDICKWIFKTINVKTTS